MKKRRSFAAALLLALLLLVGCGAKNTVPAPAAEPSETVELSEPVELPNEEQPPAQELPQGEESPQPPTQKSPRQESPAQEAPAPAAQEASAQPEEKCTVSISCAAILAHKEDLRAGKEELVPPDGWLLPPTEIELQTGESAFDVLARVCRDCKIHMEFSDTPLYGSAYIEGIGNLYEFDCGEQSGWLYYVNGESPGYGCSSYTMHGGDTLEWVYTCSLGGAA